jgi:SAM-dependent methyltransferase
MNACPLCRAVHRVTLLCDTRSGDVHRCTACGMVYSDPRGRPDPVARPAVTDDPEAYLANARARFAALVRCTGLTGGRLLDVGCYDGAFLLAARQCGYEAIGVEPSAEGAAAARSRGLTVIETPFEQAALPGPFDVVSFVHSLEHFADPLDALRRARAVLAPGGAVLVEVPNFDTWSRRLLGRRWRQFIADHFHFFEPATLRRALERSGFTIRHLASVPKIASLALLTDRVERYYSAAVGASLRRTLERRGWADRQLSLNLGDIVFAVAVPQSQD